MIRTQYGERANKQRSGSSEFLAVLIAGFGEECVCMLDMTRPALNSSLQAATAHI